MLCINNSQLFYNRKLQFRSQKLFQGEKMRKLLSSLGLATLLMAIPQFATAKDNAEVKKVEAKAAETKKTVVVAEANATKATEAKKEEVKKEVTKK